MNATGDSPQRHDPLASDKGEGTAWPGGDATLARPPRLVLGRWLWRSPAGQWLQQGMRPGADETEAIALFDGLLWGVIAGSALRVILGVVLRVIGALSVPVAAMMTANTAIRTPSKMASIQWWIGFCGGVILTIAAAFLKLLASNLR